MSVGQAFGGRYQLEELLGVGGMGQVFAARDLLLDRRVAVKLPTATSDGARERFRREARSAASLNHRNIVSVYDWGETPESQYIVMELVDGREPAFGAPRSSPRAPRGGRDRPAGR